MPEALPAWADRVPLGAARARLVRITRRGVGMTLAAALFWIAMTGVAMFGGLDASRLGRFFVVGAVLVYPVGYALNRVLGGDLTARGSEFRGLIGAITVAQALGGALIVALLAFEVKLVAFALAATLGAHFLPYGWLYRAPAYHALGVGSVALAALLQWAVPMLANIAIPASMALLYGVAAVAILRRNRSDAAC